MKKSGDLYFDLFWESYPKRVGRLQALKEWKKLKDFTIKDVLDGIERWKLSAQWQDIQFVPDPERFLKYRRWEDEVPQNAGSKNDKRLSRTLEAARRVLEPGGEVDQLAGSSLPSRNVGTGNKNLLRGFVH